MKKFAKYTCHPIAVFFCSNSTEKAMYIHVYTPIARRQSYVLAVAKDAYKALVIVVTSSLVNKNDIMVLVPLVSIQATGQTV